MSVNNVYAVSDAIKYVNGESTSPIKTSIVDGIKDSVFSPSNLFFMYLGAKGEIGKIYSESEGALAATKKIENLIENLDTLKKSGAAKSEIKALKKIIKTEKNAAKPSFKNILKWIKGDKKNGIEGVGKYLGLDATEVAAQKAEARTLKGFKKLFKEKFFGTVPENTKEGIFSRLASNAKNLLLKIPGASKVANSSFGKGVSKVFKGSGAGLMMAIDGGIEFFTNVVPAFKQGGIVSGAKQIAKSSVKVLSSAAGWVLGSKAGSALGSAIGTAICPGIGTAIGAAVGFVGGLVGSAIVGGIGSKIAGKSEVEKMEEKENELVAQNVANDQASMSELNALVAQKVQEDIASGNITEDTEKMAAYLNSGVFSTGVSSYPSYNINNQNEYNTDPVSMSTTTTSNTQNMDWLNDTVTRIQNGDTSIYNISDEKLNSMYNGYNSQTLQENKPINYYT